MCESLFQDPAFPALSLQSREGRAKDPGWLAGLSRDFQMPAGSWATQRWRAVGWGEPPAPALFSQSTALLSVLHGGGSYEIFSKESALTVSL